MIKELNKSYEPNWDEKIELSLSLRDLQLIYDCFGAVPLKFLNYKHEVSKFANKYDAKYFTNLYEELDDILYSHNGVTDNDVSINNDIHIQFNIIGGDDNE